MDGSRRPFPPGSYPVVVVGSGPGALQMSYSLRRHGIDHAVISADSAPGGMFRKWPVFQRLLSWTKPHAPDGPGSRRYLRFDWNSLLADEAQLSSLQAKHMDGTSHFPSRAEMEANLAGFAEVADIAIRYDCEWQSTARIDDGGPDRFALTTSDGEYRCRVAVFAVGVAEPWSPRIPGIEHAHHYAEVGPAEDYAGRRVFIIGKRNSAFELASGLMQWASAITLASPSPAKLSVVTKSLAGVRARYVQPFEDNVIGGGCAIVSAAIDGIARTEGEFKVTLRAADGSTWRVAADDVINATGFVAPLRDLPDIGVNVFGQSRLPALSHWWESAGVAGIYFAGTITQAAPSLGKYGVPHNSGAVHGFRFNAVLLARHIAEKEFGKASASIPIGSDELVKVLLADIGESPELWHQHGFLSRSFALRDGKMHDIGYSPLTAFLDDEKQDGLALALERDGSGDIFPVIYTRIGGATREEQLERLTPDGVASHGHEQTLAGVLRDF